MALLRYLTDASATDTVMDPVTLQQQQLMVESAVNKYCGLLLVLAIGYGMICLLSLALVVYMRHNRTVAFRGDSSAARKIILPAYLPLLLMLMAVSFAYSVYFWILRSTVHRIDQLPSTVENEIYFCGRLFFMLLIIIYMYQKSVTTPALRRATLLALVLSTYNIPLVWLTDKYITNTQLAYWVPHCSRLLIVLFFLWVLVMPPERASKRTLREYAVFALVFYLLFFAYSEMFQQNHTDTGFILAYANILWGSLCPLVIWRVLKADTEHWRGLGRRAVALQSLFRQKHRMNERISSRGLHVLIEMHRKYVIDFAYLELKHKIGVGSSAVVFNGVLHSKTPVAVKVYSPTELTDELVAEFSHEAALCGALHHPNIVKFYGMCVCPPTICLVSELCLGSLDTVTQAIAKRPHAIARQQQLIDLNYMIDAARAVAYLHSFAPAFLHRDIKPSNFLVDVNCVVKLTDFGESRSLPKECTPARSTATTIGSRSQRQPLSLLEESGTREGRALTIGELPRLSTGASTQPRRAMTVRGTVEYMAPELIQGKAGTAMYGEAADIFSLAITLWDIAHPLDEKYPSYNGNHLKIFDAVLGGQRPPLAESLHPELRSLLAQAWDESPTLRPSALGVLNTLEKIQRQVANDVAMVLVDASSTVAKDTSVTGSLLVGKMLEIGVVATPCEARRMGNGMMSAGLLHHQRHVLGFVDTKDERYIFDEQLVHAMHHAAERLYLPPISERQYQRVPSDPQPPVDPTKEQSIDVAADDDGESVFSSSVGPTRCRSKADEGTDVEGATASVAQAIGTTVSELLRFGPRRKLSRAGSVNDDDASRFSAVPLTHATSSQWANTTQTEPGVCPCKRLGAGMMYISKRGGAFHSGGGGGAGAGRGGGGKRFRRGKRSGSDGAGQADHNTTTTTSTTSTSTLRGTRSRFATTDSNGLTAKLLTSEFANTGDSATSEPSFAPTPPSASDVEMGFHVADSSEDEEDEDPPFVMGNQQQQRRQFIRRPPASGDSAVV